MGYAGQVPPRDPPALDDRVPAQLITAMARVYRKENSAARAREFLLMIRQTCDRLLDELES